MIKTLLRLLVLITLGLLLYRYVWPELMAVRNPTPDTSVVHHTIVEKVEALGRMELVRYHFADVVTYKTQALPASVRRYLPFDFGPTVQLLVRGETVGCIDFARLDSSDVRLVGDTAYVRLPPPQVCYFKIDHARSRVLSVEESYFGGDAELVDEAYRRAEREILTDAMRSQMLEQTRAMAEQTVRPLLETLSGRRVVLTYQPLPPAPAPRAEHAPPPAAPAARLPAAGYLRPTMPLFHRRRFLKAAALAAAAPLLVPLPSVAATPPRRHPGLGLILGTVREALTHDPPATLAALFALGYRYVEYAGAFGVEPAAFRKMVRRAGLRPLAGGGVMEGMHADLDALIDATRADGKRYLVCYWPWLDGGDDKTVDDARWVADQFNQMGARCRRAGLRLAFHNHDKEFKTDGGQVLYDVILQNTHPKLVTMELDLYWITKGGGNPVDYLRCYPGRFELMHFKDMDNRTDQNMAPVGAGIIDFPAVVALARTAGLRYAIVEHDRRPDHPLASVTQSAHYLRPLLAGQTVMPPSTGN